jgi:hypothetical protein
MSPSSTVGSYSLVSCDEGGSVFEEDIVSKAPFSLRLIRTKDRDLCSSRTPERDARRETVQVLNNKGRFFLCLGKAITDR